MYCLGPILWHNARLIPPDFILSQLVLHDNCLQLSPTGCQLATGVVVLGHTLALLLPPVGNNPPVSHFRPVTGKTVAVLEIEGTSCAIAGEKPLTGEYTQDLDTGQTESTTHQLEGLGSIENHSLQLAGTEAYISGGDALIALESGSKWSFH